MNVLVVYGSSEGQTRKISERSAERLRGGGHNVTLLDSMSPLGNTDVGAYDVVIVASPVHQERHQDSIIDFVIAQGDKFASPTTAFISVSLSAVLENGRAEAQSYVDRFVETTGWTSDHTLLLGGALRYESYDYFKQQIVKFVVAGGGLAEHTDKSCEFTDWDALDAFLDTVVASAAASA